MEERQFGDRVHGLGFVLCPTWKKCRELTGDDTRRQVVIQGGYFFVETLARAAATVTRADSPRR